MNQAKPECCATCRHWEPYARFHGCYERGERESPEGVEIQRGVCLLTEWDMMRDYEETEDLKPTKAIAHDGDHYADRKSVV